MRWKPRLPAYFAGPHWKAIASALLALGLLLPVWWQASQWYEAWLLADQRAKAAVDLAQYRNGLTATLNQHFGLLEELAAFVQTRQDQLTDGAFTDEFEAFAAGLYAKTSGIDYFVVAPGGIERYLYPPADNEAMLGRDLLHDERPSLRIDIERAMESGQITLSHHGELVPSDSKLTVWLALYQEDRVWGLIGMVLDVPSMLVQAGLNTPPRDLDLAVRDQTRHIFYGRSSVFNMEPLLYEVDLPEGSWQLAGVPIQGWEALIYTPLLLFRAAGLTIISLLAGLVYLITHRQESLALAVQRRTQQISEINRALEQDIAQRTEVEAALRETQRTLSTLMSNLPGMAYRCRNDPARTMAFVSEGCFDLTGYHRAELIGNQRIAYTQLIQPDDRAMVWNEIQAAVAAKQPFQLVYCISTATGETKWVWEQGRGVFSAAGALLALEGFVTDTTERVQAYQMLEQRVTDRTRELSALYEVTAVASKSLDLTKILEHSLDQVLTVMNCEVGVIYFCNHGAHELRPVVWRGLNYEAITTDAALSGQGLASRVLEYQEPLVVADVAIRLNQDNAAVNGGRAYLGAPMRARGKVLGVLSVIGAAKQQFKREEVALLASIADEVGVAVENVQLYEAERSRRRQADTLLQVASVVSSTLELDEVLTRILDQLGWVVDYDRASVQLLHEGKLQIIAARGFDPVERVLGVRFDLNDAPNHKVVAAGQPLNLADAPVDYPAFRQPPFSESRSWLGVPLRVQERMIGIITIERQQPGGYSEEEVRLTTAFADLAALALENARLYQQAERLAIMEERSRLARDLHDLVTQSLYSLTLFAEVGRRSVEGGQWDQVTDYVTRLGQVAQQALREMRLLVYELRAAALETEGLVGALQQRLDAVEQRAGVEARLLVESKVELPPLVEEGFYRIAQEALNNALKHAGASVVTIRIRVDGELAMLEVSDNGRAFEPAEAAGRGGLGLVSMRERAEQLGGALTISSKAGQGTTVRVEAPTRRVGPRQILPIDTISEVSP
jgi:PAS domain S-box-containing protein